MNGFVLFLFSILFFCFFFFFLKKIFFPGVITELTGWRKFFLKKRMENGKGGHGQDVNPQYVSLAAVKTVTG